MSAYTFAPIQPNDEMQSDTVRIPLGNSPAVFKEQTAEQRQNCLNEIIRDAREQNVTTAEGLTPIFAKRIATRRAFIQALDQNGIFTHAFATIYRLAHNDAMTPSIALQETQSYILNRRDEQIAMLGQMQDPKFVADVVQALQNGYIPPEKKRGLTEQKKKVLVDELAQLNGLMGKEPAIHIQMTARGHVAGHTALAKTLDPNGPLASVLSGVMMPLSPHMQPEEVTKISCKFLEHFQRLAIEVVEGLQPNGEIVQEAIRQSEEKRQKSGAIVNLSIAEEPSQRQTPTTTVRWMQLLGSFLSAPFTNSPSRAA